MSREAAAVVQRHIRRGRVLRVVIVLAAVLNALMLAVNVVAGSLLALLSAAAVIGCLLLLVKQARLIGIMKRRERELARPRMTLEDYRHLREMEAELGWELTELPAGMTAPAQAQAPELRVADHETVLRWHEARMRAAILAPKPDLGDVRGDLARDMRDLTELERAPGRAPMTGPGGRWRPLSELPGTQQGDGEPEGIPAEALAEGMRRKLEAAEHFAALARVGREHCLSYCPVCLYRLFGPLPDGWPAPSTRKWLEENWGWKR